MFPVLLLEETFSVELFVIFPKHCLFQGYIPYNFTSRGLFKSLNVHIPKHIYIRHVNQVIAGTQMLTHAAEGSNLFLKRRHCP